LIPTWKEPDQVRYGEDKGMSIVMVAPGLRASVSCMAETRARKTSFYFVPYSAYGNRMYYVCTCLGTVCREGPAALNRHQISRLVGLEGDFRLSTAEKTIILEHVVFDCT